MKKIIKNIILSLLVFFVVFIHFLVKWAIDSFNFLNFDEILFQLTSPLNGTEASILESFFEKTVIRSILLTSVILVMIAIIIKFFQAKTTNINMKVFKKKIQYSISGKKISLIAKALIVVLLVLSLIKSANDIGLVKYIKYNYLSNSDFFKKNYIDTRKVKLTFPENKRNLVYIYVESLESSYFTKEKGGSNDDDVMSPIEELTSESINYSDNDLYGGFFSYNGTNFTTGSLVAQTSGIPLKVRVDSINLTNYKEIVKGAYTLGEILNKEGYNQMFMIGSQGEFGNRKNYFVKHGNYDFYDYYTAREEKKINKDYFEWWGFEDSKLFEYAKEKILEYANEEKPFNFSILTANTHHPDGYIDKDCEEIFTSHYSNSIYCSVNQVNEFVRWIQEQDFYENTTIIIVGDHATYKTDYLDKKDDRDVYNLIINSPIETSNNKNRLFSAMDMFPTTLATLNVKIDGDRLGLGTNLFSNKKTLSEKYGEEELEEKLQYSSKFYLDKILLNKK